MDVEDVNVSVELSLNSFYLLLVSFCVYRLEQEKSALQKKLKARGVTADQVVGVRSTEMEKEMEELKKRNSDLETEILTIKYLSGCSNVLTCRLHLGGHVYSFLGFVFVSFSS